MTEAELFDSEEEFAEITEKIFTVQNLLRKSKTLLKEIDLEAIKSKKGQQIIKKLTEQTTEGKSIIDSYFKWLYDGELEENLKCITHLMGNATEKYNLF
jgi:hypothetical protein